MKSIYITAEIKIFKAGEIAEKMLEATFSSHNEDHYFRALLEFQKDAKKIFKEACKASDAGHYVRYDVVVTEHDNSGTLVNSEAWKNEGYELFYEEDDGKKALYLEPDTRYTRDSWDMVMHSDVITSLAEAGI